MNDPIYPVIVFFLALGAIVGWLMHLLWARSQTPSGDAGGRSRVSTLESERDRLRADPAAARAAGPVAAPAAPIDSPRVQALEDQVRQLRSELATVRSSAGVGDGAAALEVRSLKDELHRCRESSAAQQAEIARLEGRVTALQASARGGAAGAGAAVGTQPPGLPGPEGDADDLKRISGIGPGIERTLNQLGIHHFRQIAAFTPDHVAWVDRRLRFKGRIAREKWIEQAKSLAAGATTDISRRQDGRKS